MAGTLYDENNVVVGNAVLWLAPWVSGTVVPLVADTTPLWDTTAWTTAGYVGAGATNEGFKLTVDTSTTTITIEEQSTPVGETIESKAITIEADLAEATMQSLKYAWGGDTIVTTAAATGTPGTDKMTLTDVQKYYTAALETKNPKGMARRIYIPKVSITGSGDTTFRRASDKQMFPFRVASLCKPTDIQIVDITAAAL